VVEDVVDCVRVELAVKDEVGVSVVV